MSNDTPLVLRRHRELQAARTRVGKLVNDLNDMETPGFATIKHYNRRAKLRQQLNEACAEAMAAEALLANAEARSHDWGAVNQIVAMLNGDADAPVLL